MRVLYRAAAVVVVAVVNLAESGRKPYDVRLPEEHMGPYFHSNPEAATSCRDDPSCPYQHLLGNGTSRCWGYEPGCQRHDSYSWPLCPEDAPGWASSKEQQEQLFFGQGDFGFVRDRRDTLALLCRPEEPGGSLLECVRHMELCRAKHVRLDFGRLLHRTEPVKYSEDVLGRGAVGGYCRLDKESLRLEGSRKSPLQSWFAELEHFQELPQPPPEGCDLVLDRPTVLMKLDATVNMYHHFCDFLNLYLTLHLNGSLAGDFDVLIWDTLPYRGTFQPMWSAFHGGKLRSLAEFKGRTVCLREALFAFLPRMVFGMYYNLPLVPGCHTSGVFRAFNRHVLHRLGIPTYQPANGSNVRVTLLSRGTKHRRILNEQELVSAAEAIPGVLVQRVEFSHATNFRHQVEVMAHTDVLVGMHGAGLTHVLFQPDWAVLFEIFNCEDPVCYQDLARLRGVRYLTWENSSLVYPEDKGHHPTLGAHAKFTSYSFDVGEFVRLLGKAIDHVRKSRPKTAEPSTEGQSRTAHDEM